MPPSVQGLRGTSRGLRSHGHPRHDPLDAPPPRAPKPKAPASALTFKTGSYQCVDMPVTPNVAAMLAAFNPSDFKQAILGFSVGGLAPVQLNLPPGTNAAKFWPVMGSGNAFRAGNSSDQNIYLAFYYPGGPANE